LKKSLSEALFFVPEKNGFSGTKNRRTDAPGFYENRHDAEPRILFSGLVKNTAMRGAPERTCCGHASAEPHAGLRRTPTGKASGGRSLAGAGRSEGGF
jgi:hypothetical protein